VGAVLIRFFVAVAVAAASLVIASTPASAINISGVDATVTVTGGDLSIAAPASADLGTAVPGTEITAQLGTVTVTDLRGLASASWVTTVTFSGFATGAASASETIPAAAVDYWSGPATSTEGVGTFSPGQPTQQDAVSLASDLVAFSEDGGDGGGAASWNPTLIVHLPAIAVAGSYVGTMTQSVV
jgi:hypothetical protein